MKWKWVIILVEKIWIVKKNAEKKGMRGIMRKNN